MKSLRHIVVELLALVLLGLAAFTHVTWLVWLAGTYVVLSLGIRAIAVLSKVNVPRPADAPPEWAYHVIYAVGLLLLGAGGLYGLAALWAVLWVLDWYSAHRR